MSMSLLLLMLDLGVVGFNQDMEEDGQDLRQRQAELLEQQRLEEEAAQEQQRVIGRLTMVLAGSLSHLKMA
jgi:hypothetical protein